MAAANRLGVVPLPPYIRRRHTADERRLDLERYQTVYADRAHQVAVAAPTAGLHFTPAILEKIAARGVEICQLTLHVGLGTFQPIRSDTLVDVAAGGTLYRLNAQGGLVMVAPNWAGQAGLDTYGVQPMATPPRPPTAAPLRFIRCSGTGGVNPYVGMIGEDKCSNIRPRP